MTTCPGLLRVAWRGVAAIVVAIASAAAQAGPLRCSGAAIAGGAVTIQVGCNTASIDVYDPVSATTTHYTVPPGRDTTIVIPPVPAGTRLVVSTGRGICRWAIEVEVVSPP